MVTVFDHRSVNTVMLTKQVDILISKNQALQMLYLKHCVHKTSKNIMDKKPTKGHIAKHTILFLIYCLVS